MGHAWKTGNLKYHFIALGDINTAGRSIVECVAEKLDVSCGLIKLPQDRVKRRTFMIALLNIRVKKNVIR
jgi:hypothetical protein